MAQVNFNLSVSQHTVGKAQSGHFSELALLTPSAPPPGHIQNIKARNSRSNLNSLESNQPGRARFE
jgi:hypothetical protein